MEKFNHVVGIIHTNYVMYSRSIALGQLKGSLLYFINQGMCRAYCHKVIKLSAALQEFAPEKEVVCNVHGAISINKIYMLVILLKSCNKCRYIIPIFCFRSEVKILGNWRQNGNQEIYERYQLL